MNVIQPLLDLQEVDERIRELEKEEKDIPALKARENARFSGVNAALKFAQEQLDAMHARIENEKDELAGLEAKLKLSEAALNNATGKKELEQLVIQQDGIRHEIEGSRNRIDNLETIELKALEIRLQEAEKKAEEEKGGTDDDVAMLDARFAEVEAQLAECRQKRKERALEVSKIDPEFLLYYERVSTKRWPAVVALSGDGVCEGCHMKQPQFVSQLVRKNQLAASKGLRQERAACTMCGRLLYEAF